MKAGPPRGPAFFARSSRCCCEPDLLSKPLIPHMIGKHLPCADEIADRCSVHLPHDVAPMQFHRDLADAEVEGDLLVQPAERDLAQDLPLARGERREALCMLPDDLRRRSL